MICPKCQYERSESADLEVPDYQCPKCGVIYAKVKDIKEKQINDITYKKNSNPIAIKIIILVTIWCFGAVLSYFLVPYRVLAIFILYSLLFWWVLKDFGFIVTKNIKSGAVLVTLLILFMTFFSSYEAFIDKVTGFDGAEQRVNALNAGFSEKEPYLTHLSEVNRNNQQRLLTIAKQKKIQQKIARENGLKEQQRQQKAIALAKKNKEDNCKKELSCIGEKITFTAGISCDQLIEKFAKYSFKWTDGFFEPKFSKYRWKDSSRKVVTTIGDKIQFQNRYGAMQNHIYFCDINIDNRNVIDVRVLAGRL